ncbi:hypothetical protein AAFF_G00316550 [Aldrovandia affinis]|uniref:Uncharacterized protein n=1 Tax=Aldrovandia affinis TaxID=143900 RepID=A0AAD7WQU9_9TELE|nr:hypothetical protein AAFF_G00316550 [Aldrovandia affinis]
MGKPLFGTGKGEPKKGDPGIPTTLKGVEVQCPVCLPQLLLDGTGGRNASVTCPSPDNIWETGWLFATIPKEHLIVDHPPLTMSLWMVLLYMCCLPHTDGRPETLMRSPSSPTFTRLVNISQAAGLPYDPINCYMCKADIVCTVWHRADDNQLTPVAMAFGNGTIVHSKRTMNTTFSCSMSAGCKLEILRSTSKD